MDNGNRNITKLELLFNLVMGKSYNIVFVLTDEWNKLKEKYVSDIKNGKKYNYIEHSIKNDDIIVKDSDEDVSEVAKEAQNVFGVDIVEIK